MRTSSEICLLISHQLASTAYLEDDPDFVKSVISGSIRSRVQPPQSLTGERSTVPSAATTSRLYQPSVSTRLLDVGGRRRQHIKRPIGRAGMVHRAVQMEGQTWAPLGHDAEQSSPPLMAQDRPMLSLPPRGVNRFRPRKARSRGGSFSSVESGSSLPSDPTHNFSGTTVTSFVILYRPHIHIDKYRGSS